MALAFLAGCGSDTAPPSEEVARGSVPLTGSATQSLPAITLRNAILTQPFDPELMTPDGRLGLSFLGGSRVRFIALGDPAMSVTGGTPRFVAPMAQGQTLDVDLPPLAARTSNFQRTDGLAPLYPSNGFDIWTNSGQGALSLDPRFSPAGKPFPVNEPEECLGATPATRERVVSPGGRYECYRLIHFQPYYAPATGALALHQALVAVVVDARRPDTTSGTVARAAAPNVVRVQYLSNAFSLCRSQGQPFYLWALEASATADARLVVSEGGRWSYNETPWNPDTWTRQRELGTLFDSVRLDVEGTRRICRHIAPASGLPSCTTATEEDFARVYPVAARPIFLADGSRRTDGQLPTHLECGYTWITPEGTDVFCRPNPAINGSVQPSVALELTQGFESSTGMHFFAFGQHTGWTMRRLDSAINSRRFNPEGLNSFPPAQPDPVHRPFSPVFLNTATGFWAENRTSPERAQPLQRQWPLFQFMSQDDGIRYNAGTQYANLGLVPESNNPGMWTNMQYWEVSFACGMNPHCLLHLPMNELFYDKAAAAGSPAILRALPLTQDVSNNTDFLDVSGNALTGIHPYVGQLQGGAGAARFAGEVYGVQADERYLSGYRGTAISLTASGFVSVGGNAADLPSCRRNKGCLAGERYDDGFTAEVAFLALFNPSAATLPIARHHGLWSVRIQGGTLAADVSYSVAGVARALTLTAPGALPFSSLSATPAAQAASWRHVALRIAPDESRVSLLVDGMPVAQANLEPGAVFQGTPSGNELLRVGPGGQCTGCPAGDVLFVDELVFHRSAQPFEELAAAASVFSGRQDFLTPSEARTLLARYFSVTNPRRLTLQADGFPRFVRAEDLRIPAAFRSFLAVGQESAFRQLVSVGETLFRSPVLSTNAAGVSQTQVGTGEPLSCSTCHRLDRTFTDGRATALGVQPLALNTPTIVNRVFGTNQFFARRSQDLLDLALEPVVDPREMNADVSKVLERINTGADQASLRQAFANVFLTSTVTREQLELALTAYELVQLSVDSLAEAVIASGKPVVDGEGNLLRPELLRLGRELFEGKARCGACHVGSNFTDELAHDTSVAASPQAFKTPTLWDVASTAPYFHDGSRATLRQVLDFYNQGGNAPGRVRDGLRMIDPELRPLALSEYELMALEQYLRALRNAEPVLAAGFEGLAFSNHGPIPGMSCISVNESADPAGWADNYLCSPQSRGIVWSGAGPVAGMRCTAITEVYEPPETTWTDNYLCVPSDSPLRLSWSMSGPLFGKSCVRFHEPADPHTWSDNYLCYDEPLRLRFSAEGPISGMTCTLMDEGYDQAGGWNDNHLCTNKDIGLRWSMGGPISGMRCTQVYEDLEPVSTTWGDNYACVPRESEVLLSYSQGGPLSGLSCAQLYEPKDPQPWIDNYLCYREEPLALTFHAAGAPAGLACTSVNESQDQAGTWGDNYFCANRDIGMQWSGAGPISGMRCTQVNEPAEPASTTWSDNYLCLPQDSRLTFEWSYAGPIAGRTCVAWAESADPHSWLDNYLCYGGN
ncbi:MAG TPA: cytochrome c peroxidase [Archangium sp.]|uniref:cytochrome-c peroxidase n=1 Tax=Archangium sp. TaxID=1872627 RepID=UPI002E37008C|nr:cytochrome c peroxidase [Archangium sp.]HEX5746101.1 cytochrome c peroxidase [Archangium sp.]